MSVVLEEKEARHFFATAKRVVALVTTALLLIAIAAIFGITKPFISLPSSSSLSPLVTAVPNNKMTMTTQQSQKWRRVEDAYDNTTIISHGVAAGIVWLMSFPNSGTSYTIVNTERLSNTTTATNYGDETTNNDNRPRQRLFSDTGPFVHRPEKRMQPESRILTKTHCHVGVEADWFWQKCHSTSWHEQESNRTVHKSVEYNISLLTSSQTSVVPLTGVVHLVRNPLDNLVSRMHLRVKRMARRRHWDSNTVDFYLGRRNSTTTTNNNNETTVDSNDVAAAAERQGFLAWCRDQVDDQTTQHSLLHPEISALLSAIPCYTDLLYYLRWHNLACRVTRALGGSGGGGSESREHKDYSAFVSPLDKNDANTSAFPVLILHYEDYIHRYNETVHALLDFLRLSRAPSRDPVDFQDHKTYHHYYTMDQRNRIAFLVEKLASPEAWNVLFRRYFDDDDLTDYLDDDEDAVIVATSLLEHDTLQNESDQQKRSLWRRRRNNGNWLVRYSAIPDLAWEPLQHFVATTNMMQIS